MFDDVQDKDPVIIKIFCWVRHNNCDMFFLNQNLFSIDRQILREIVNIQYFIINII